MSRGAESVSRRLRAAYKYTSKPKMATTTRAKAATAQRLELFEEGEIDCIGHGPIASIVRMKMVL
jgi:hypothetical protein